MKDLFSEGFFDLIERSDDLRLLNWRYGLDFKKEVFRLLIRGLGNLFRDRIDKQYLL